MEFCHSCGAPLSEDAAFCAKCGIKVASVQRGKTCPGCGAEALPDMVFCDRCGMRLSGVVVDDTAAPAPPIPPPAATLGNVEEHKPSKPVVMWCCLGVGLLSYLVQAFLYHPQGFKGLRPNLLLVLLFALQTPCFLLAFTSIFHSWFKKKDWLLDSGFRRGLLLSMAGIGSVLSYFIARQGERLTFGRIFIALERPETIAVFLTLQLLGIVIAAAVLALGEADGTFGWQKIRIAVGIALFFSLVSYLETHTSVFGIIRNVHPNRLIMPYQFASLFVIGWKLFWEAYPLLRTRSVLPKIAVGAMIAAVASLVIGSVVVTQDFVVRLTKGAAIELYVRHGTHAIYDPILLPFGLLLAILSAVLWFLGSQKQSG